MPPKTKKRAASPVNDVSTTAAPTKRGKKAKASDTSQPSQPSQPSQHEPSQQLLSNDEANATDKTAATSPTESSTAQFATHDNFLVPVDEHCGLSASHKVYIGDDGIIYDAALNQTNSAGNNNKFYRIQLLTDGSADFCVWTRWGRVGETGQNATLGGGSLAEAMKLFEKKFKDKSGLKWDDRLAAPKSGKYVFVERSYEAGSDDEDDAASKPTDGAAGPSEPIEKLECTLSAPVKSLMELIFNAEYIASSMADLNYDAEKLPLGKLSKTTILRGYEALKRISAIINDPTSTESSEQHSNTYYSLIPHDFGRSRPPVIQFQEQLRQEVELMDSLTDLKEGEDILKAGKDNHLHFLDVRFNGLNLQEMTPIKTGTTEYNSISEYLHKTIVHQGHKYEVVDVFRVERSGEEDQFVQSKFSQMSSDRRLLWHGSRATNFGGILRQGLRIAPPEAPVSGYMFGKGIYLADMASKSANYCVSSISGGNALLLLCEAELGDPMQQLVNADYAAGEHATQKGVHSTFGMGSTGPPKWKDGSCIHTNLTGVKTPDTAHKPGPTKVAGACLLYNEYICYDVAQVRLRYLLRVKM